MEIVERIPVPTGDILIVEGEKGKLECLSLGDYGKDINLHSDALGLTREIDKVEHTTMLPLEDKWVVTISTQYGCSMGCKFCLPNDAPILMHDYSYKNIQNVRIGDFVIANWKSQGDTPITDYATLTTTNAVVTGLIKRKYTGKMYVIKTENGHSITCTDEHPIAAKINTRNKYVSAKNIKVGQYIITTEHVRTDNYDKQDFRLGWVYGFLLGDGTYDEIDGKRWMVSQKDIALLQRHKYWLEDFNIYATEMWETDDHKGHKGYRYAIQGQWVDKLNSIIDNATKSDLFKVGFISGFWDAEGYSFRNNQVVRICNTDYKNIQLFEQFVSDLGFEYHTYESEEDKNKNLFITNVNISRDKFNSMFTPWHKKSLYLDDTVSRSFCDYSRVVNIETYDYDGLVYNIETSTHNYYAYDVLTHNCDVPKVGPGRNATYLDLLNQVKTAISIHPEVTYSKRLNIHYARMGEPTWNENVLDATVKLNDFYKDKFKIHPVVSTMMPRGNKKLAEFLSQWVFIKNQVMKGEAGLQLSINSTNDAERDYMFSGNALSMSEIGKVMSMFDNRPLNGRKYTLNFAVADWEIDPNVLLRYFNPEKYIIKLTPMHKTATAIDNKIETVGDYTTFYPYKPVEESLKNAGYDVLVFIASYEEDMGRITCGNAILSGTRPEV